MSTEVKSKDVVLQLEVDGAIERVRAHAADVSDIALLVEVGYGSAGTATERARAAVVELCPRPSCSANGHCTALRECTLRPPLDELAKR